MKKIEESYVIGQHWEINFPAFFGRKNLILSSDAVILNKYPLHYSMSK